MFWEDFLNKFDDLAEEATGLRPPYYGNILEYKQTWGGKDNPTQFMRIVIELDKYYSFTFKFFGKLEGLENNYKFLVNKKTGLIYGQAPGQGLAQSAAIITDQSLDTRYRHRQSNMNIHDCQKLSTNIYSNNNILNAEDTTVLGRDYGLEMLLKFKNMQHCKQHDYLDKKKVYPYSNLKINKDGVLFIPYVSLKDTSQTETLQRIWFDHDQQKFTKKIVKDHKANGVCYIFQGEENVIYLCEGWATAATVNRLSGKKTLAFIGSSGLKVGANMLRTCSCDPIFVKDKDKYGFNTQNFVVIADNDNLKHINSNPGIDVANKIFGQTGIPHIYPDWSKVNLPAKYTGSDFNDFANDFGDVLATQELTEQTAKTLMVTPKNAVKQLERSEKMKAIFEAHTHVDYFKCRNGKVFLRYKSNGYIETYTPCVTGAAKYYSDYVESIINQPHTLFDILRYQPGEPMLFEDAHNVCLNMYQTPNHIDVENYLDIAKPFFELVDYICGVGDIRELFLDFLATLVQRPKFLMPIAPIIISSEKGRGKGLIIEIIVSVLGEQNCAQISSEKLFNLNNKFNAPLVEKHLVYSEEIEFNRSQYTEFKNMVTGKQVYVDKKFITEQVAKRTCNFIFSCNDIARLSFDADERRFLMIEIVGEAKPQEFYDNLGKLKDNSPEFIASIDKFLRQRMVKNAMTHIHPLILQETTVQYARESYGSAKLSKAAAILDASTLKDKWTLNEFQSRCDLAGCAISRAQAINCLRNHGFQQCKIEESGKQSRAWRRKS